MYRNFKLKSILKKKSIMFERNEICQLIFAPSELILTALNIEPNVGSD